MTQLRKCKCGISNYFDTILGGIGHRGSSFTDVDAVTHDVRTHRFLFQEFKQEGEKIDPSQYRVLKDLVAIPKHFTVWIVVKRRDGQIGWSQFSQPEHVISVPEYQARFAAWWADCPYKPSQVDAIVAPLDVGEIHW